ncbi:site-specific integrase [Mycolicibacterium fortuitum]|uniref:site-specific integrase n=1 Tax=Mycolicibacterium fortuitum TaxID=1766 RepID=UPI00241F06AE|nr:site-specific integrase [Mycolicibacterium fortuitum]MDG5773976.1 site-specific integrase [Mycolicibacterium fortuitum]MDG5779638.1 site-specific integrase [Mycolicibacterium fortuitum]MDG5779720.1 site-specific integrase [Mycolicibacterium fortuitum]
MAGRPPLRIGQHGKIKRIEVEPGVWIARCRYRDTDGVTRIVERKSPKADQYGKLAEDALMESLAVRQHSDGGEVTLDSKLIDLVTRHIDRLEEDGRADRTIDTYRYCAKLLTKVIAGVRVRESTPARIDAAIRSMRNAHGDVLAVQSKTIMKGGLQLAVMADVIPANPARDVSPMQSKKRAKGAQALTADELRNMLTQLRESELCQRHDLVDPITLFVATGLRISELLGLRWADFEAPIPDRAPATLTITGKVVRAAGKGLRRIDETKTAAGTRTLPLPTFGATVLSARRSLPYLGEQKMIFPSTAGTWRDPDNFRARWREVRDALGVPDATSHSFRKTVATLIDDEGLSARIGADHLGHSRISMTQDKYMARGRSHTVVADLLDRTISDG